MSRVCGGRFGVTVAVSAAEGVVGGGITGATTGVVTGGENGEPVAGRGDDDIEVAPTQTSTATSPRLMRRPHEDCQSPPSALLSAEDGSLPSPSTRSSLTWHLPPGKQRFRCHSGLARPSLAPPTGKRNG